MNSSSLSKGITNRSTCKHFLAALTLTPCFDIMSHPSSPSMSIGKSLGTTWASHMNPFSSMLILPPSEVHSPGVMPLIVINFRLSTAISFLIHFSLISDMSTPVSTSNQPLFLHKVKLLMFTMGSRRPAYVKS